MSVSEQIQRSQWPVAANSIDLSDFYDDDKLISDDDDQEGNRYPVQFITNYVAGIMSSKYCQYQQVSKPYWYAQKHTAFGSLVNAHLETKIFDDSELSGLRILYATLISSDSTKKMELPSFSKVVDENRSDSAIVYLDDFSQRIIEKRLSRYISNSRDEVFEDGMISALSRGVEDLVLRYGEAAVEVISRAVLAEKTPEVIIGEILSCLGRIDHEGSEDSRFTLLSRMLSDRRISVRECALIALDSLGDNRVTPLLKVAIQREPSEYLRREIASVIDL